jgi:predicted TPR repeat methyltransferase
MVSTRNIIADFDRVADSYDNEVKKTRYFAPEWIAGHVQEFEHLLECRVLDLGCATGLNINMLCERRAGVCADGVDIAPKMLEHARSTGRYERLYLHDLSGPLSGILSDTYDLVIAFGVLDLLTDVSVCLSECHRVLKVNGTLWASFPRSEAGSRSALSESGNSGYSSAEILHLMSILDMRVTALDPVLGCINPEWPEYRLFVLQALKMS